MTQKNAIRLLIWALAAGMTAWNCTKSTTFGSELLEDQLGDYNADTLTINVSMELEDSLVTSDRSDVSEYFLCGEVNDQKFGLTKVEIFSPITLTNFAPDFDSLQTIDSVVLILPYAASGFWGDSTVPQNIRVFRLHDTIAPTRNYYSTASIPTDYEIGKVEHFLPRPRTPYKVQDTASTATKVPHLRVPLDTAFGRYLTGIDSLIMTSDVAFWRETKGIKIEVTPDNAPGALLAFNLNSTQCFIRVYYKVIDGDTLSKRSLDYLMRSGNTNKFMHFMHDRTGTPAESALASATPDLLYLQGMQGIRLKVEFPTAAARDSIAINRAELVFSVADLPGDPNFFTAPNQLTATEQRSVDTTLYYVSDLQYSFAVEGTGGFGFFGGTLEDEGEVSRYRINLSKRMQDMVDDTSNDPANRTIYINLYQPAYSPQRAILYGPNHTTFPARMYVKYTRVK